MNYIFNKWQEHLETGIKYLSQGDSVQAEEHLQESLKEADALGVPVIIAFSQRLLANAQVRNQKLREAESGFRRALEYCLELNNMKGIAEAKAGLAGIYYLQGEYLQAVNLYRQAINSYPPDSSPLRLAVLYSDLGQVYSRMKQWEKAEAVFRQSGELCRHSGYRRGEAEVALYLGEINYSQGQTQAAKKNFLKAARIFGVIGDDSALANSQQYLAFILLETNKIQEALLYQYRVIALHFKHNQQLEISEGYYLLSYILQYGKLFDQAEESLKLSLEYYQGPEFGFAVRYHSLAVIAIMKKEYQDAKKYYFEALKYFQFYGDGSKIGEISEELTYLLKYKDASIGENPSKWLEVRYFNADLPDLPKYEVMFKLSDILNNKGNKLAALRYSWRALEIARAMKAETQQIEVLIQKISESIRKKNR